MVIQKQDKGMDKRTSLGLSRLVLWFITFMNELCDPGRALSLPGLQSHHLWSKGAGEHFLQGPFPSRTAWNCRHWSDQGTSKRTRKMHSMRAWHSQREAAALSWKWALCTVRGHPASLAQPGRLHSAGMMLLTSGPWWRQVTEEKIVARICWTHTVTFGDYASPGLTLSRRASTGKWVLLIQIETIITTAAVIVSIIIVVGFTPFNSQMLLKAACV